MFSVILWFCAIGTPPHPENPTCQVMEYRKVTYPTMKACQEAAPLLIVEADKMLAPMGRESFRQPGKECIRKNAA